ncbi:protein YgfX [Hydrocarboniphaga sp.]|uniref:protein YgfX n=1 Tax=Hydrocarboniphaga sp. TaxID=2033016 RepID=UPI003D0B9750
MLSSGFESTLDLRLVPSLRALRWLYAIHFVPLIVIAFAMQQGLPMIGLALAFGCSWFYLRRHRAFGYGPRAIVRVLWQPDTGWRIWQSNGAEAAAALQSDSYVQQRLLVLNFRYLDGGAAGRRNSRVLLGDELPADALRRLRALLLGVDSNPSRTSPPDASG